MPPNTKKQIRDLYEKKGKKVFWGGKETKGFKEFEKKIRNREKEVNGYLRRRMAR